jgi:inhibitor of KinA
MSEGPEPLAAEARAINPGAGPALGETTASQPPAELTPLGDAALVVQFGEQIAREVHGRVRALADYLDEHPLPGLIEYIPAYTTLTLFYDPGRWSYRELRATLEKMVAELRGRNESPPRTVEIPVCYGGEFGPDLDWVAQHAGLSAEEVVRIHSCADYLTYMIGFAPGFPYLGGMPERIAAPRRAAPRLRIPAGSVGIAGTQTGVYPIETPGGWQLIGRTPRALFRPQSNPPSLLRAGDLVRFLPISREQYAAWQEPIP